MINMLRYQRELLFSSDLTKIFRGRFEPLPPGTVLLDGHHHFQP